MPPAPESVAEYFAELPDPARATLQRVREAILGALPSAEERFRYGMPAVMLNERYALHYAAWKKHVGLYPIPRFSDPLEAEVSPYRSHKDSVRFLYAEPVPLDLIGRIAARLGERQG